MTGQGDLTAAEQRTLRSLAVGDVVEVHRVERITVAERTEHGVFPGLIGTDGTIAPDLAAVRVIHRAPRPLEPGEHRYGDLGDEHLGMGVDVVMPGIGVARGEIIEVTRRLGYTHLRVAVPVPTLDDPLPVAMSRFDHETIRLHPPEDPS